MKKKLLATALVATMVLSMTACGGKENPESSSTPTTEQQVQEQTTVSSEDTKIDENESAPKEEVGAWAKLAVALPGDTKGAYININYPIGYAVDDSGNSSYGVNGIDNEKLCAVLTGQNTFDEVTVESADSVLIAYEERVINYLKECHSKHAKDYDIEILKSEMLEINGIEMCRYEGEFTYTQHDNDTNTDVHMEKVLVGYSAPAANGAYAIWVVVGFEEHANKVAADAEIMANTFVEVE